MHASCIDANRYNFRRGNRILLIRWKCRGPAIPSSSEMHRPMEWKWLAVDVIASTATHFKSPGDYFAVRGKGGIDLHRTLQS